MTNKEIRHAIFLTFFFICINNLTFGILTCDSDTIHRPKKTIKYIYQIFNNNKDSIGFIENEDTKPTAITSICIFKEFLFLPDPVYGNIKRININNGKYCVSKVIKDKKNLGMVTIFNNSLYLLTDDNEIFILDKNLNTKNIIKIPNYYWEKNIYYQDDYFLEIYRNVEDVHQLNNLEVSMNLTIINKENFVTRDTINFENHEEFKDKCQNIRGTRFDIKNTGNTNYLKLGDEWYEINIPFPSVMSYYNSKNIDFADNKLTLFDINSKELIIYIYFY